MTDYQALNDSLLRNQNIYPEAFHTTDFWEYAANELAQSLHKDEIKNFRNHPSCLSFFVPTYGAPGNGLTEQMIQSIIPLFTDSSAKQQQQIDNLLNGYEAAKADHRLILALEDALNIDEFKQFTESACGNPRH